MKTGIGFFSQNNIYDKVRPDYDSLSISNVLVNEFGAHKNLNATEVAAGSGKFTSILLNALSFDILSIVEPDENAIKLHKKKFCNSEISINYINNYSDSTHIEPKSLDCIFISQAFHFFPIEQTRKEFIRILKPQGKVFIFGRFLLDTDEVSNKFILLTRFGKRLNGYENNIQAYDKENITSFYGKNVEKKIINSEGIYYTKDELINNVIIRINASGDEVLLKNTDEQKRIIDSITDFYTKYKDESDRVKLEYQSFYFCSDIVNYKNSI